MFYLVLARFGKIYFEIAIVEECVFKKKLRLCVTLFYWRVFVDKKMRKTNYNFNERQIGTYLCPYLDPFF